MIDITFRASFELMRQCLNNTKRPIVYSVHDVCTGLEHAGALPWVKSVPVNITFTWQELGLKGKKKVRDLWLHKNIGKFNQSLQVRISRPMQ